MKSEAEIKKSIKQIKEGLAENISTFKTEKEREMFELIAKKCIEILEWVLEEPAT